jgi:hypothetical protein
MADENLPADPQPHTSIMLKWPQRIGAISGGVILGTVGGLAELWARLDGIGTVSFVVAGTALVLLGMVGRMPTRLSSKDYSVEFFEQGRQVGATQAVENVVEELSTSAKKEIAQKPEVSEALDKAIQAGTNAMLRQRTRSRYMTAINRLEKGDLATLSDVALRSLEFEGQAIDRLKPILGDLGYSIDSPVIDRDSSIVADYTAKGPNNARLLIFLRRWTGDILPIVRESIRADQQLDANPESRAIIVIDNSEIADRYRFGIGRVGLLSSAWPKRRLVRELTAFLGNESVEK